ncbi:2-phosphosulfolactate phosphatase [Streptomyces mirabilis]|uniref:2-phosphosulfolactate phosphatase n=1 Tax=Streptomyces mirabilis TaxID=68239 RepID=UPI0036D10D96
MSDMSDWYLQQEYGVRFEWGAGGAERVAGGVGCLVVVDVLSFSTSVNVAVEAGTRVHPYAWRDETASVFARDNAAELAVGRRAVTAASPWSLSPAALRRAPFTPRLVLPSPNGSAIAAAAGGSTVVAGCLRNASAVGRWLALHGHGTLERPLAVIAAGERWPDGSLRPGLEDLMGAGAVIAALQAAGGAGPLSPRGGGRPDRFHRDPRRGRCRGRVFLRSGTGPERLRRRRGDRGRGGREYDRARAHRRRLQRGHPHLRQPPRRRCPHGPGHLMPPD